MLGYRGLLAFLLAGIAVLASSQAQAQATEVTFAGVAYSGSAASIDDRFKYASWYEQQLKAAGDSGYKHVLAAMQATPAHNFNLSTQPIEQLKGRDQALVTALVLTSETVSVERFGDVRKLFILERAQAMFFDFKSMTVVRSYPMSFAYIDNLRRDPTNDDIEQRVRLVFEGAGGKPGLYGRYAALLAQASLPAQSPRLLQVSHVSLPDSMVADLPSYMKSTPSVYETWAADIVSEAVSSRLGVPLIPYAKGYAVSNVMSMKVSDGDVYNLKLPSPDYEIDVDFTGLKKVKLSESGAGASWAYGALAKVHIVEPLTNTTYFDSPVKNAELKIVPASQSYVDDFPAYYDAVHGLFTKLFAAVAGGDTKWVKAAAAASDIDSQLTKTKQLMEQCK